MAVDSRLHLFLILALAGAAASIKHNVVWDKNSVQNLSHKIKVQIGDEVEFRCPLNSYSNIYYMVAKEQFTSCDCGLMTCFKIAQCSFFIANTISVEIRQIARGLQTSQDYKPGETYYFASFSPGNSIDSDATSGGECSRMNLRLEMSVLPVEGSSMATPTDSNQSTDTNATLSTSNPTNSTEEEIDNASGNIDVEVGSPANLKPSSSSLSLPLSLSSFLLCLLLAFLLNH